MLAVISPAKTLDFDTSSRTEVFTQPDFLGESQRLIKTLRKLSPADIGSLMRISDKLAALNTARYENWSTPFTTDNAKQAILAFKGDVYTGLDAETMTLENDHYAQQHLRILSGLYGLLRPLDLIQPYRLEMGSSLANERGKDLYGFWGERITGAVNSAVEQSGSQILINLASNEYFKGVKAKALKAEVVTPVFKDEKNGQFKVISFFAKKARGLMTRYMIENELKNPEDLKAFNTSGYAYDKASSDSRQWVFTRKEKARV